MACNGGCIAGPGCLKTEIRHISDLNKHAASSNIKTINESVNK
jgi:iron only hydrogenase large subunit-like protein